MRLYPVIYIKNGYCVRPGNQKIQNLDIYSHSPVKVAKAWENQGATYLQIIDLDGALVGHSVNETVIKELMDAVSIPVQVGGGIRTIKEIENALSLGAKRVVIGTVAVQKPAFIKEALTCFSPKQIVISIDVINDMVAIEGREKISTFNPVTLAMNMKELGIETIILNDIQDDIVCSGPNIQGAKHLQDITKLEIILAGGIHSLKDIESISNIEVSGILIDNAIYDNKFDLKDAVNLFENPRNLI